MTLSVGRTTLAYEKIVLTGKIRLNGLRKSHSFSEKIILPVENITPAVAKVILSFEKVTLPNEKVILPSEKVILPSDKVAQILIRT